MTINPMFGIEVKRILDIVREKLDCKISVFVSPSRVQNSDDLTLQTQPVQLFDNYFSSLSGIANDHALIVRSLRNEQEYWDLEKQSLSTISMEGWKGYGTRLGLWNEISEMPNFDEAFVLKPDFGCWGNNVYLFHPHKKSGDGFSTRTKITNAIEQKLVRYIQPYHDPENPDFLGDKYHMIRRVFFGFNPNTAEYESLGGMWMARTSVKVHGASDSISGPIIA